MTSPSIQASDKKNRAEKAKPVNDDRSMAQVKSTFSDFLELCIAVSKFKYLQAHDMLPGPPKECNCTPFSSGLFTWMRIFRFADSLMRQGC